MSRTLADSPGTTSFDWDGRTFELHPEAAVSCAKTATVWVADTHFGKPASFRSRGIPVPDGGVAADTARLDRVVARAGATRLVILGDLLHDAASRTPETFEAMQAWREGSPELEVVLVRGNHDDRAGDPPATLAFSCHDEPHEAAGVVGRHHPPEDDSIVGATTPVFAGHVHPVAILRGPAGRGERVRCFHWNPARLLLPAFGSFTGGHRVKPRRGDRVFAIGPSVVVEVPVGRTS